MQDKKFAIKIGKKTINFGSRGSEDFTHKLEEDQKNNYIGRHQKVEN